MAAGAVRSLLLPAACLLALLLAAPAALVGQASVSGVSGDLLGEVMPEADRFEAKTGSPPVIRAYRGGELLGFVFETADIPPEQLGYSGPVQALVGLGLDGVVTGARVMEYWESYRSSMGDFLRDPGVQEQFAGKSLTDPFQVNGDVRRVTRATISTQALARGIRDASRTVAEAYAGEMEQVAEAGPIVLEELSWFEMRTRGVLKRILIEGDEGHLDISMAHLPDDSVATFFLGAGDTERIHAAARREEVDDPSFVLYALAGPRLRYFLREGWHVAQDGDTLALPDDLVYSLGVTDEGRVASESTMAGVFMLDDRVDRSRPLDLLYAFEGHEGYYAARFDALRPPEQVAGAGPHPDTAAATAAEEEGGGAGPATADEADEAADEDATDEPHAPAGPAPPTETDGPDAEDTRGTAGEGGVEVGRDTASEGGPADVAPVGGQPPGPGAGADSAPRTAAPPPVDLGRTEEGSELARTLAATDWGRAGRMAAVIVLALAAFFLKRPALRWLSLGATLVVLGWLDGSFLSVSHLTAGIWVGPSVFLRDLPLLLLVVVTAVTTLVWGRVFCGFLCPFGALQDVLERVVPKRVRIRVPDRIHRPALKAKYLVLAAILLPALLGSHASLYQWFEPFGTVFFLSPSGALWAIAGLVLVGAALIPRFYCRYACPLGAGLAVVSFLSPRRIGRVEQCDHCVVCQEDCPTLAIRGPAIDFPECVRCNRCETNLLRRVGTCRHDMETVRSRLVQIRVGDRANDGAVDPGSPVHG